MHRRLTATTALAVVLAISAASCGGTSAGAGDQAFGAAAKAIPAHPLVFVDVNLDHGSAAWQQAMALGKKFPGWNRMVKSLQHQINSPAGDGTTFAKDVEPWLGNEAAIAVTGVNVLDQRNPVDVAGYVAVRDEGKLKDALAASHARPAGSYQGFAVYRDRQSHATIAIGKGALLISNDPATLHHEVAAWQGGSSLASQPGFAGAMATLPENSLVRAYADGTQLGRLMTMASAAAAAGAPGAPPPAQLAQLTKGLQSIGTITAAFGADAHGLRLAFNVAPAPGHHLPTEVSGTGNAAQTLLANVPADAFAYIGGGSPNPGKLADPQLTMMLRKMAGLSWTRDVAPLLTGPVAGYAGPGAPYSVALMLKPADPARATAAMSRITAAITRRDPRVKFHWLPGHRGQVTVVQPGMTVGWHRVGDVIAISNDPAAGAAQSSPLSAAPAFQTMMREAGAPADVSSLAYLDVHSVFALVPAGSMDANLAHLGGLAMWSSSDASGAHFTAYLQVR